MKFFAQGHFVTEKLNKIMFVFHLEVGLYDICSTGNIEYVTGPRRRLSMAMNIFCE